MITYTGIAPQCVNSHWCMVDYRWGIAEHLVDRKVVHVALPVLPSSRRPALETDCTRVLRQCSAGSRVQSGGTRVEQSRSTEVQSLPGAGLQEAEISALRPGCPKTDRLSTNKSMFARVGTARAQRPNSNEKPPQRLDVGNVRDVRAGQCQKLVATQNTQTKTRYYDAFFALDWISWR